jgi:hypothetical protein
MVEMQQARGHRKNLLALRLVLAHLTGLLRTRLSRRVHRKHLVAEQAVKKERVLAP